MRLRAALLGLALVTTAALAVAWARTPRLSGDEERSAPGFDRVERIIATQDRSNPTPGLVLAKVPPVGKGRLVLSDAKWRRRLAPESYDVLRRAGTERPFDSPLLGVREDGEFVCGGCGAPLFEAHAKFDSGTGWPSFYRPVAQGAVWYRLDSSGGLRNTEALCARCDGHLGHVFADGPKREGGFRYCIDGAALRFVPKGR